MKPLSKSGFFFAVNNPQYPSTLDYLYERLPMFQRIGPAAYKADLNNTNALCNALGNPQEKIKCIHVAGTNGKGSSSHMLAAILQSAGYRTGLYTSPHLKNFTERIRINGKEISQDFVVDFVSSTKSVLENIQPSFFETTVVMAFDYFEKEKVDIAVIEVGLGGRLDSTNVIHPLVSLITNIGYDHTDLLGNTLPKIAFEKAGIIKHGVPVIISERQTETETVFKQKASDEIAHIFFASDHYQIKVGSVVGKYDVFIGKDLIFGDLVCELKGQYQKKNLPGVLMVVDQLVALGFSIPEKAIRMGIEKVSSLTGLKGRWQQIGTDPLIICDTGHNEDGIREIVEQIRETPHHHLHMVLGTVNDKDISRILKLLPRDAKYYFCQAKIPRALPAMELKTRADAQGLKGTVVEDVNNAIRRAKSVADPKDLIFVGGSTFVVAEIINL